MEHLDDTNPHTFGAQDLEKLIKKVSEVTRVLKCMCTEKHGLKIYP